MLDRITVRGARQHNLRDLHLEIPRNTLTVVTGLSGSGKSSLAFDTIYAEGQRRYVETLSPYARQFLDQMERPDVDSIDGLSPALSIEQTLCRRLLAHRALPPDCQIASARLLRRRSLQRWIVSSSSGVWRRV